MSLAYGSEFRVEQYQAAGRRRSLLEKGPVNPGVADVGSSGREGIGAANAVKRTRNNVGVYVDVLSDISDKFLVGVAGRFENYSDFGANVSGKVSTRYKFTDLFSVRGSINRGFRAPSMHQLYYSNYADAQWLTLNGVFDSYPIAHLRNDNPYVQQLGVGKLKAETTLDYNLGLTAQVTPDLVFTADAYQIDITDRVVISGQARRHQAGPGAHVCRLGLCPGAVLLQRPRHPHPRPRRGGQLPQAHGPRPGSRPEPGHGPERNQGTGRSTQPRQALQPRHSTR
ncbi:TonB-dependent receptor plug domain-containing protein [Hymenobacter humi]|uniref:TonB-dependent receptor plug domain-containing protein n=1 Tax=Hymenobacter humi TaxID=1411620 RepID=A0ABW2U3Y1_9BACT